MPENLLEGSAEAAELVSGEAAGLAAWPDSGVVECLVGVDVSHAVEKGLVEQGGLDGRLAMAEEGDEVLERDGERLFAWASVGFA